MRTAVVTLRTLLLAAGLAAVAGACASRGGSTARAADDSQAKAAAARPDLITAQEIAAATTATNAYDLIQQLRPQLLNIRGIQTLGGSMGTNSATPTVYLDRAKLGGTETLRSIALTDIVEVRYFNATMAATRFGPDERAGVILLTTRK